MEECVLPCSFQSGPNIYIDWINTQGSLIVHSYTQNQDQLRRQHRDYTGRTSLFQDEISRGNASLLLTDVQLKDEGRYMCVTRSDRGRNHTYTDMKVFANTGEVSLKKEEEEDLVCRAEGIYPQPEVSWTPSTEHNTVYKRENGLYSVVSSVRLSHLYLTYQYSCNVSTQYCSRSATYRHGDQTVRGNLLFLPVIFVFSVVVLVLIGLYHQQKKQPKTKEHVMDSATSDTGVSEVL